MRLLLFSLLLGLAACQEESRPASGVLVVSFEQTMLLAAPGSKNPEMRPLKAGETLRETGLVSNFVTPLTVGDSLLQAPWVQVQTTDQQTGWVFAAAVRPQTGDARAWLLQQQMKCFFGPGLTNRRNHWAEQHAAQPAAAADFARDYREAMALRDTLMGRLAARVEPNEAGFQPDFYWLGEALPGFVFQLVAEGTQPYAFADYGEWLRRAGQSKGEEDDRFVGACLAAFATDSIEAFYPVWQLQTWDYGGSSQLGLGQHLHLLKVIDAAGVAGPLFEPELRALKDRVLTDILEQNTTYWQPAEKIVAELEAIIAAPLACLSERDRLALNERRKVFDDPAANGVRVNLRAGE